MSYAAEAIADIHDEPTDVEDTEDISSESGSVNEVVKQLTRDRPPYTSNVMGKAIRHARTGAYYDARGGTWQQRYYFKVCDASGKRKNFGKSESDFYFYDSPSDYRKYGGVVHPDVEAAWNARVDVLPSRM